MNLIPDKNKIKKQPNFWLPTGDKASTRNALKSSLSLWMAEEGLEWLSFEFGCKLQSLFIIPDEFGESLVVCKGLESPLVWIF